MKIKIFSTIRAKMIAIFFLVCFFLLLLSIFTVTNLNRVAKSANIAFLERIPISRCATRATLAVKSGARCIDKSLLVKEPENIDKIREYEGNFRDTMIEFNMFMNALIWGSESVAFKRTRGGLTYAQWKRRGWAKRMVVRQVPYEIRQLAGRSDIYYGGFSKYGKKIMISQRRILRLKMLGKDEDVIKKKIERERYIKEMEKYEKLVKTTLEKIAGKVDSYMDGFIGVINETAKKTRVFTTILFSIFFVVIITLGVFVSGRLIIRPIRKLIEGVENLRAGELGSKIAVHSSDEIGELTTAFNQMSDDLRKKTEELEKAKTYLEDKVRERTKDLQETNVLLKKANQMKAEFCANMSHELRTPLNSIIGFTGIILKGMTGEINEEQRKQLNMVYGSAKHLLGLINDILDLSKIEAGKIEVIPEDFEVDELINTVEKLVSPMVEDKGLKLITKMPEKPLHIYSDRNKVEQILINLLSNAVKFTDKGEIEIECSKKEEALQISVSDTGRGIREENLKFIFDEFRQISDIDESKPIGTGLGLAISQKMVEMLGGRIWAESEYGKGSKFTFILPLKVASEIEREPLPRKRRDITKKLILTIDDQKEAQEMLRIYLESEGYEVVPAYTGTEAIQLAKELKPFAITLDIIMPGKYGWDILQELKRTPETESIPVIVVSIVDNKNLGLSLGSTNYLVKPIEKDDLIKSLRHLEKENNIDVKDILIIDDNHKDVEYISAILKSPESNHHQVRKAYSGREGLDLTKKQKPDLILLDLMMPEMDGFEVVRELKKNKETKDIPIIVITAKDLTKNEVTFLRTNIEKIVIKGQFAKEELLEDIKRTLMRFEPKGDC